MSLWRHHMSATIACYFALTACSAAKSTPTIAASPQDASEHLLALLPAGADIVIEIHVARIRDNEVLAPLVGALIAADSDAALGFDRALVGDTERIVVASYHVGTPGATTVTLVRGRNTSNLPGMIPLRNDLALLGDAQAKALVTGDRTGTLLDDRVLFRLRALAIPPKAHEASLRLTARLDFDARVSLASLLGVRHVPQTVSIWADVVDDLAVVAMLGGETASEAKKLTVAASAFRARIASHPVVRRLLLSYLVRRFHLDTTGHTVRGVLVIPPTRLARVVGRLQKSLATHRRKRGQL